MVIEKNHLRKNKYHQIVKCDEFDNFNCKYILDGYEEGSFKHDKAKKFTLTILSEIELFDESKVYNIQIKGVADGIPNNGISDWRNIIKKCKKRNKGRINDKHLAVLRACYIIDELDNTNLPSLLTWKNKDVDVTFHDHPDGINQGSKYRKTEFYYSVLGHCDGT